MKILFFDLLSPWFFLIIAVTAATSFFLLRYMYKKEKEFETKEKHVFDDYQGILKEAHSKAETIVEKAAEEATTLTNDGKILREQAHQEVEEALKKIIAENLSMLSSASHEYVNAYHSTLQQTQQTYEKQINTMLAELQKTAQTSITSLQQDIQKQMIDDKQGISKRLQDEFEKTQMEIAEYKQHKLQQIQDNMNLILVKVSGQVLSKAIPMHMHQELINEALEKAEKEIVF